MIKVVIVDDHQIVIEGIHAMCQSIKGIKIIGSANDQHSGFKTIEKLQPDVAIIDINLEQGDGIDLVKIITQKFPNIQIGMLTMHNQRTFIQNAMDAGAKGYLIKNSGKEEFETGIKELAKGKRFFSQYALQTFISGKEESTEKITDDISISSREQDVLQLISEGKTSQEIADLLFISINTVKTHRKHLFEKLDVSNSVELIKFALQNDLVEEK